MSEHETHTELARPRWLVPMKPRSPDEPHRVATPLELFFDLVFVVAVSQAASALHHGIAELHAAEAVLNYVLMFFGVWWAWMNFTWFASAYDNDDVPYRLLVFVQMTGALIFAAGVTRVFEAQDLSITVLGYIVMRVATVMQWLRAARSDPEHRPAALRYALGVAVCQVAWVILLTLPTSLRVIGFLMIALVELLVPVWAERASPTPWHRHHITERYGLFTIIVLGESILSAIVAIETVLETQAFTSDLISICIGGLLIVFALWWLYFNQSAHHFTASMKNVFIWAYGHLLIFGATAAVGAGLAVVIDQVTHHAEVSLVGAELSVAIPITIYLLSLWALQDRPQTANRVDALLLPIFAGLILLTPIAGQAALLLMGILLAVLIAIRVARHLE